MSWDERFQRSDYVYGLKPNDFLVESAHHFPAGGKVLSLGEGEGRNAVYLAEQGFDVTALDGSAVGLEKLSRLTTERGVTVHPWLEDVTRADLGQERWDGIYNIFCHLPSEARAKLYGRVREALKPGGVFVTEQFCPAQLQYTSGGPKDVDMLPTIHELKEAFSGWDLLVDDGLLIHLDEGSHHQGPAMVARLVARKP